MMVLGFPHGSAAYIYTINLKFLFITHNSDL